MDKAQKLFTDQEVLWVRNYIDRKFLLYPEWLQVDHNSLENEALAAYKQIPKKLDPDLLQAWCDQWLNRDQRKQLLNALRAKKKRKKDTVAKKNLSLDRKAWLCLSSLAKRDRVTISQFLINRLEREYLYMDDDD